MSQTQIERLFIKDNTSLAVDTFRLTTNLSTSDADITVFGMQKMKIPLLNLHQPSLRFSQGVNRCSALDYLSGYDEMF